MADLSLAYFLIPACFLHSTLPRLDFYTAEMLCVQARLHKYICSLTVSVPACVNEYISLDGVSVLRQTRWISPSLSVASLAEIEMETFSTKTSWDIIDRDTV